MKRSTWLLAGATLLFFWLALDSMVEDSPTMDEQNHLARGLAFLRTGDPRLSVEHPPLINALSALPLLSLQEVRLPTDHPSWNRPQGWYEFAELFLWQYNHDVTRMVFLGRLPIVFLTLGLALAGLRFARSLWGRPAGVLAYTFLLFDPNILAHGRYTTTDVGGTLFVTVAAFLLWRCWNTESPRAWDVLLAGLGFGLAYSSKLSSLVFGPIFALVALLPLFAPKWTLRRVLNRLLQFAAINLIALAVVWALFAFQSGPLNFANPQLVSLNGIPGPMPTFWSGVEQIVLISEGGRPSFLLGQTSVTGFPTYFLVAFLSKTPAITLLLLVVMLVFNFVAIRNRLLRERMVYLVAPALLYFIVSMQSGLNIGYRHLLPILSFVYVAIAGMLAQFLKRQAPRLQYGVNVPAIATISAVLILVASTIAIHPHYLSFFNVFAGGAPNGYRILVDSNIDWGQDLLRLEDWMGENNVEHVKLAWFGTADPNYYGISYDPLPGLPRHFDLWWSVPFDVNDPEPGIYAISVSNLWELPLQDDKGVFAWFRARPPTDRVAYSIFIYEVK